VHGTIWACQPSLGGGVNLHRETAIPAGSGSMIRLQL
jgi:hypothetical protein